MIVVLGYGMIGSVIANKLSSVDSVTVIDKRKIVNSHFRILQGDPFDFMDTINKADVIVSALPGSVAYNIISKLLSLGKKVVDVSFIPETVMSLNDLAVKSNGLLIPDCGYAPGLTNIISGYFYKKYDAKKIEIFDGGLPIVKVPPLDYSITWSVEGLLDMYTRPARYIKNNELQTVDPLDSIEKTNFPGIGELESFMVDGLGTLLSTLKGVDIFERTYRYPGHLQKIKFLRDMGYLSNEKIDGITPRSLTKELFEKKLVMNVEDLCILEVKSRGKVKREVRYIDYYDRNNHITSMGRMTGFPAAAVASLILDGKVDGTGIMPPEYLGFDESIFNLVFEELRKMGLNIEVS
ncbi:MAG: saccharopine dehydrogenase C-terminal domain-containing protein [Candidatus Micrarchaeia archaeon]